MKINCIAVDDEPFALSLIISYIEKTPFLNLVAGYANGVEALHAIHEDHSIQLIFLDIRMADLSGIELARIVEQGDRKKNLRIVFTTAFDQYAIESYKVDALDYLLKPFNFVDFSRAAAKAYDYFQLLQHRLHPGVSATDVASAEKKYLYLKVDSQLQKLDIADILYIEGLKDYVKIILNSEDKPLLTLSSLKSLEEKLPGDAFLRIHRSFIVGVDHIRSVTKNAVQIQQTSIPVTDQYKAAFAEFLKSW